MNRKIFSAALVLVATAAFSVAAAELQEVATFPDLQATGVAVSKSGRVFVNFPDWSDPHTISVAEIVDGKPVPYPNAEWNQPGPPATHFVCVQSVVVDAEDNLWVVDPAAPKMQAIVQGGPKLVKIDLKTNTVVQTIPFGEEVAPTKSYLNDVRIENATSTAYLTDSGKGAIVVVDLKTGKARRLLEGDKSTAAEKDVTLTVEGKKLFDQEKKSPLQIQSDGIALDAQNGWLYYHALTGHTLYRIRTNDLRNAQLSAKELSAKVENLAQTPAPDGMLEAPDGSVYLTAIEDNAIVHFDPMTKKISQVISDKRLSWPDTMSWGPDGMLFVTASQIQNMPRFNDGRSTRSGPYQVFKIPGAAKAK